MRPGERSWQRRARRTDGGFLERSLSIAALGAVPPAFLMTARNAIFSEGFDAAFGARYWACVTAYFLALGGAVALAAWAVSRLAGALDGRAPALQRAARWLPRAVVAGLAAAFLAAALLGNGMKLPSIASAAGPLRFRLFGSLATVASLGSLAALAALPLTQRRTARALCLCALLAAAIALLPRPGASAAPPALAFAADAPPLCLIGLDGADWNLIERLFSRGELPHLRELRARGAWGPLGTVQPTRSWVLWNTMATGRGPEDHGIDHSRTLRFPGLHRDFRDLEKPWGFGLSRLYRFLGARGIVFWTTSTSADRRVPAYWNLATRAGGRVAVLNWWASWPAEPVNGFVVSDRIHYARLMARGIRAASERLTHPPELYEEIKPLLVSPEDVTLADARRFMEVTAEEFEQMKTASYRHHVLKSEFKYMYAMFETNRRIAQFLLRRGREEGKPMDFLLYFRLPDLVSHAALKYSELADDHLDATPEEIAKFGRVVSEAYRQVDRAVGEIATSFGEGNVLIVSDHGFTVERPAWKPPLYEHASAPPGIFLGVGPAFRPGRVEGLSIREVFPTIAYLKGLPIAQDVDGRVALEALLPEHVAGHGIRSVATYGAREAPATEIAASPADRTMIDRLRALGYVQ